MIAGLKRSEINKIRWDLRAWYQRPVGRLLQEMERRQLEEILPTLFGYHLLQVGSVHSDDLLASSRISHRVVVDPDGNEHVCSSLVAYPDSLPVIGDSVDVAILPHTLEFERDPHEILREIDRILIPEGHIVVLGFNPWSIWGLRRLLRRRKAPWNGDFLSLTRLKDWMALLGFDIVQVRHHFFRPPLRRHTLMTKLGFMEKLGARFWPRLGGAYVLVARKRVTTLTPIKPRWRPRRGIVAGVVRPTTSSGSHG